MTKRKMKMKRKMKKKLFDMKRYTLYPMVSATEEGAVITMSYKGKGSWFIYVIYIGMLVTNTISISDSLC
jgi:hypothetical protein